MDWDRTFKTNGLSDQGDYFAEVGDVIYARIKNSHIAAAGCAANYLGIAAADLSQCGGDFVDASIVTADIAPMIKVELFKSVEE